MCSQLVDIYLNSNFLLLKLSKYEKYFDLMWCKMNIKFPDGWWEWIAKVLVNNFYLLAYNKNIVDMSESKCLCQSCLFLLRWCRGGIHSVEWWDKLDQLRNQIRTIVYPYKRLPMYALKYCSAGENQLVHIQNNLVRNRWFNGIPTFFIRILV